ncbi:hypothetical protein CHS0354_036348 [Potamilus streckersoni]|uniref:Ninjurin-2 n=1 Tax=Potamilus streckersoni TaxID=2493646 RepID=A0AAE0SEM6_9BIVA|nr:hypothetical protein CHS0354_036348 [Potamilus streckersoni]
MASNSAVSPNDLSSTDFSNSPDMRPIVSKNVYAAANATNVYSKKSSFIHRFMDVALLSANVFQLKVVLDLGSRDTYYILRLFFIIMSITLQVIFTFVMVVIKFFERREKALDGPEASQYKKRIDIVDKISNVLVIIITVSNVFIATFGVGQTS